MSEIEESLSSLDYNNSLQDPDMQESEPTIIYTSDYLTPSYLLDSDDPDSVEIQDNQLDEIDEKIDDLREGIKISEINLEESGLHGNKRDTGGEFFARIVFIPIINISDNQKIMIKDGKDKTKILMIETLDDFDEFTERYGFTINNGQRVSIKWTDVANDYHGLFINQGLENDREDKCFFDGETYDSWWVEWIATEVGIFVHQENLKPKGIEINNPFNGYIFDEFAFSKDMYIKIFERKNPDKILLINNHKDFDTFSNEYGEIIELDNDPDKIGIQIRWDDVNSDYFGFYISKDYLLEGRDEIAFFESDKYISWMLTHDIVQGMVYQFE